MPSRMLTLAPYVPFDTSRDAESEDVNAVKYVLSNGNRMSPRASVVIRLTYV